MVGREEGGYLKQTAHRDRDIEAEFYCLRKSTDGELLEDPEDEDGAMED